MDEPHNEAHEGYPDHDDGDHRQRRPGLRYTYRHKHHHSWHNNGADEEHTVLTNPKQGTPCRVTTETINSTNCSSRSS